MDRNRYQRILNGAANWCAYYRENPHRFAHDYLHLDLFLFQKILLVMMMWSNTTVFIGSRGIGKSFLSAVFCVIRAILWPGSKIVIASGKRSQSINVLSKIMEELVPRSPELAAEIDMRRGRTNIGGTMPQIIFYNGSFIKVVTASDSARSARANFLLLDECRLISKEIIDTILKKFLTDQRMPAYSELSKKERKAKWAEESNKIMYLTSAYTADSWVYTKCVDTFRMMMSDKARQFLCGLPYQLAICEGSIDSTAIMDELIESDFNQVQFDMEYGSLFWGNNDGSFFDFDSISKNRKIKYAMMPDKLSVKLNSLSDIKIKPKVPGEFRILSADIALMSSKKKAENDATAIFINSCIPTKSGRYMSNIVYGDVDEGLRTEEEALKIRKLYDEYSCDYIVLDCAGLGLGVFDALSREIVDSESGEIYPALSCCNDDKMAERCTDRDAPKVIWSIKASIQFNSDCAWLLREAFRSGRIRLLCTEYDMQELFEDIKGYNALSPSDKMKLQMPYINTTLLVDELTKLQHEESNGKVKVFEKSGMRKDRYSSLAYNYYVATRLESRENRRARNNVSSTDSFIIRQPQYKGKTRGFGNGRKQASHWY